MKVPKKLCKDKIWFWKDQTHSSRKFRPATFRTSIRQNGNTYSIWHIFVFLAKQSDTRFVFMTKTTNSTTTWISQNNKIFRAVIWSLVTPYLFSGLLWPLRMPSPVGGYRTDLTWHWRHPFAENIIKLIKMVMVGQRGTAPAFSGLDGVKQCKILN